MNPPWVGTPVVHVVTDVALTEAAAANFGENGSIGISEQPSFCGEVCWKH